MDASPPAGGSAFSSWITAQRKNHAMLCIATAFLFPFLRPINWRWTENKKRPSHNIIETAFLFEFFLMIFKNIGF